MSNFKIQNTATETLIEVYGDIGESWFEEGVTLDYVKNRINNAKKIKVSISSFGGDAATAFAIYNLLKNHKYRVETEIIAPTASSGTIIFMAGDKRTIRKPSLFLAHNALTMGGGNVYDFEKIIEDLKKWDNQLIDMYMNYVTISRDELVNLMREDKWISPEEVLEYGFATEVKEDSTSVNNVISNVRKKEIINKLKYKIMNKQFTNINKTLDVDGFESQDDGIYLSVENMGVLDTKIKDTLNELQVSKGEFEAINIENSKLKEDLKKANTNLSEATDNLETVKNDLSNVKGEKEKIESDYNKLKAKSTQNNKHEPPLGGGNNKDTGEGAKLMKNIKNRGGNI